MAAVYFSNLFSSWQFVRTDSIPFMRSALALYPWLLMTTSPFVAYGDSHPFRCDALFGLKCRRFLASTATGRIQSCDGVREDAAETWKIGGRTRVSRRGAEGRSLGVIVVVLAALSLGVDPAVILQSLPRADTSPASGEPYRPSGAVQSACGLTGSAVGPFFCPSD